MKSLLVCDIVVIPKMMELVVPGRLSLALNVQLNDLVCAVRSSPLKVSLVFVLAAARNRLACSTSTLQRCLASPMQIELTQ